MGLTIATNVYGASGVEYSPETDQCLARYEALGFGNLYGKDSPLSLSRMISKGGPSGFVVPAVRDVRASVGAITIYYAWPTHTPVLCGH